MRQQPQLLLLVRLLVPRAATLGEAWEVKAQVVLQLLLRSLLQYAPFVPLK